MKRAAESDARPAKKARRGKEWTPSTWRQFPIKQQALYKDPEAEKKALERISGLPPLVYAEEIENLKSKLAGVAQGQKGFVLQGGDCAERFVDCNTAAIENKMKIILQMSLVLTWGARTPVIRIGRIAGQYAKPRSKAMETVDGKEVFSFKGDNVNGFDVELREPDPARLVDGYFYAAATLNYIRALMGGGFADLNHPQHWDLGFVANDVHREEYEKEKDLMLDALDFLRTVDSAPTHSTQGVNMHTSHEGLFLGYEESLTRKIGDKYYNVGAHFLWIGDRTRALDGAHIEYFRGIANPIGCKVGPTMKPAELVELVQALNPDNEPGRITLITRFGADNVQTMLPPLIDAVQAAGLSVVWLCDPCHGNTTATEGGVKTRDFGSVLEEVQHCFSVHRAYGQQLGGVHFEMTGEDVTECIGGPQNLVAADLARNYESYCDPRLNYAQSMEMAFLVNRHLKTQRSLSKDNLVST